MATAKKPEAPAVAKPPAKLPDPITTVGLAKTKKGYVAVSITTQGDKIISRQVHSQPAPKQYASDSARMAFMKLVLHPDVSLLNIEDDFSDF